MRASLFHGGNRQDVLAKAKEADAPGIENQAAGTLFMIFEQVDLRSTFVRCPSMNNAILFVKF
jgi:hypothetical protein